MLMKALSLRQPWAYAVVYLGKPFENREWRTNNPHRKFRGTFLIHASLSCTKDDQAGYEDMIWNCGHWPGLVTRKQLLAIPEFGNLERGGIVGIGDITGSVVDRDIDNRTKHISHEWYTGPFAFELANVKPLPFTPCKGMLGFFQVDTSALGLDAAILATNKNRIVSHA